MNTKLPFAPLEAIVDYLNKREKLYQLVVIPFVVGLGKMDFKGEEDGLFKRFRCERRGSGIRK